MIRVLVADDFDVMMQAIRRLLATYEGVQIVGEVTRFEELETVANENQDVILANDYLPPTAAAQGVAKLREIGITTPILVMSAHRSADSIRESFEAGANGYILKEEFLEELLPAIRAVHGGERYLSPMAKETQAEDEAQ